MQLNRRDFLKLSGATLASGTMLSQMTGAAFAAGEDQLAILYDPSKCIGCRACQMACKSWNKLPRESGDPQGLYETPQGLSADTWNIIKVNERTQAEAHFFNYQCMHCVDAACVTVCPSGALFKDERGFTAYNVDKCVGCGYCTQWCPYGVPHLHVESVITGKAKSAKCTFCQDRIWQGIGGPSCVEACPVGALEWGAQDALLAQAKERVVTLQGEGLTSAKLYGETQAGGLRRLSILFDEPEQYNLPSDPKTPAGASIWQNVIQSLGAIGIVGASLAAFAVFLISRSQIEMEAVE
jgi:formate dehydrogenase iron-sulfur subunit